MSRAAPVTPFRELLAKGNPAPGHGSDVDLFQQWIEERPKASITLDRLVTSSGVERWICSVKTDGSVLSAPGRSLWEAVLLALGGFDRVYRRGTEQPATDGKADQDASHVEQGGAGDAYDQRVKEEQG